jgi:hypothetical protein
MFEVYLSDEHHKIFSKADVWAKENCVSYRGVSITDVSDFSLTADEIASYKFDRSTDAAFFTMMWKK